MTPIHFMNLILLFKEDFIEPNRVRLSGRRFDHITSVLKVQLGSELCVGQCDGKIGKGKVVVLNDAVELDVVLEMAPPAPLDVTLILALPRPHLLKRSLFFASMLGIKEIHLLNFNRVEKSLWNSSALKEDAIREHLTLGLEQAKDTQMPMVTLHPQFKPFVEDQLPNMIKGATTIVAHPDGDTITTATFPKPITLIIGPEGGIIPYELELLSNVGAIKASFGPRILRVDAALAYIVSRLF